MENQILEGYRLSPQQERLLTLHGPNSTYRTQCAVSFRGTLQRKALTAALQGLVDRHEILRTAYRSPAGVDLPLQIISDSSPVILPEIDFRALDPSQYENCIDAVFEEEFNTTFNLEQGEVLRAKLLTLSSEKYTLIIASPAICTDAWSMRNMLSGLAELYSALLQQKPKPSSGVVVQYADFAQWQSDLLETEDGRKGKIYWSRYKDTARTPVRLPFESEPEGNNPQRCVASADNFSLTEIGARTEGLISRSHADTSAVVLACWQCLLQRYTAQAGEIVVDVYFPGRRHEYLHRALGCFGRHIPIASSFDDDTTFADVLYQTHRTVAEAERWQDFLSGEVVEEAGQHRIGFTYDRWPDTTTSGGLTLVVDRFHGCSSPTKLELVCLRRGNDLGFQLRYDPTVYLEENIQQLSNAFLLLLASATERPHVRVSELTIMSLQERTHVLTRWNQTSRKVPEHSSIHELFEQQVQRTPSAVAVTFEQTRMTYDQLNRQANVLADRLRSQGVGPESIVGLFLERSAALVVGMLGILKVGGAYTPLEPTLPQERLKFFLREAQVQVVLTQRHLLSALPEYDAKHLFLEAEGKTGEMWSDKNPAARVRGQNLAYVIFTSGSAGKPKGVAVEHRQLVNYVLGIGTRLKLSDIRSFATVSTISADLGNTAIYTSLCSGGELHIISRERASDAAALAEYLFDHPVDCLKIVPQHLAALISGSTQPEQILPKRCLILGGEALSWGTMRVFQSHAPGCQLFNHYGPSEATVGVLTYDIAQHDERGSASGVPLGYPLPNSRIYLLDKYLQPVPFGVPGEVCIAGAGLTRGYIHHPEWTAGRFVPDPFSDSVGSRLYRTGDMARYLANGAIDFLGRIDRQVKLRGFRIEPGEIEAALSRHPCIRESVVVVAGESGYRNLVAYVVADRDQGSEIEGLSGFLRTKLPEHMVPSQIVLLDRIPLTPNGKVDHRALPAPEHFVLEPGRDSSEPRTIVEEILSGIFMQMLGSDRVSIHDDFFDIGGHSLLATRLLSRIGNVFEVDVSLRDVFEFPTIAGLAQVIETALGPGEDFPTGETPEIPRTQSLLLSMEQESLWDRLSEGPQRDGSSLRVLIALKGALDIPALEESLQEVMRRHEILRTLITEVEGEPRCQILATSPEGLSIQNALAATEDWVAMAHSALQVEAQNLFDPTRGPLLRATLLRVSDEQHALLLSLHHLIADAWSIDILIRELSVLYDTYKAGQRSSLLSPSLQYADFARWQRQILKGERLAALHAYWRGRLEDAPRSLPLPIDSCRREAQREPIAHHRFLIPQEVASKLFEQSMQHGVTLSMMLLAAWQTLLFAYSGQEDIVVAFPSSGRSHSGAFQLIGPCAKTLLLRTDLSGDPLFSELLTRVRRITLGAFAHQDLPTDQILGIWLAQTSQLAQTPQWPRVSTMLKFLKSLPENLRFGDLKTELIWPLDTPRIPSPTEAHALNLVLGKTTAGLEGLLEYDPALFSETTISQLEGHWQDVLQKLAVEVDLPLSSLQPIAHPGLMSEQKSKCLT